MSRKPFRIYQFAMIVAAPVSILLYKIDLSDELLAELGYVSAACFLVLLLATIGYSRHLAVQSGWTWCGAKRRDVIGTAVYTAWGLIGFPMSVVLMGVGFSGQIGSLMSHLASLPRYVFIAGTTLGLSAFVFFWLTLVFSNVIGGLNLYMDEVTLESDGAA